MGEGRSITVAAQFAITRSVFFIFVFLYAQFGKVASYHFRSFFRLAIRCAKSDRSRVLGGKGGVGGRDRTGRTCGRMRGSENGERLNERTNERAGGRSVGRAGGVSCSVSCEASRRPPSPCRNTAGDIARAQHSMTEKRPRWPLPQKLLGYHPTPQGVRQQVHQRTERTRNGAIVMLIIIG